MSDSSEDEDLSKFREAVDNSFLTISKSKTKHDNEQKVNLYKAKSERYLEEASHYNDVKVPEEMQRQIGAKVSAIIERKIKFVEVQSSTVCQPKIMGGVKLFRNSDGYLSCQEAKDTYTEKHNLESKKLKKKRKKRDEEVELQDSGDRVRAVAVTGEYILAKGGTKHWKSRRKEKLFKYKSNGKVLTSID